MDRTQQKKYYTPYESDNSEFESDSDDSYTSDSSVDSRTITGPGSERPVDVVPAGIPRVIQEMLEESNTSYAKIIKSEQKNIDPSRNTSLIMISSRDRDTRIYPQPTFFTLRLPRTFKNIKSITITQLNLLNSFFNFTTAKGNTNVYVRELGRTIKNQNDVLIPNDINIQIRNGTYSASELVSELNNAMNQTPLFADISGGLGSFIQEFQGTGNYSLLFNQPGPVVFNSLTGQYESNVTMSQLIARYFQTVQTVGTVNYSYDACLVAYYYPIIKEMTARGIPFNTHADQLPSGTDPYYYILFGFQGLDDAYILYLIKDQANIPLFEEFRTQNTFLTFLVNQYTCAYNSLQGRLRISATSLNQSIQTDLQNQYATFLNEGVVSAGFSNVADFQCRYNSLTQQNGALLEFYNFIHRNFTNSFGINFGQYTAEFFANKNNEVSMYNIANHRGWNTTLTPTVSSNAISQSDYTPSQISTPLTNITFPKVGTPGVSTFLSTINLGVVNFSNASETTFGYTDISFSILPTSYFRTEFESRCRQTVSMMTIPRYTGERGPGTEEIYPFGPELNQTPLLFDVRNPPPSSTIYIRTDISGAIDFNLYDISQVMFEDKDFMRNENRWLTFIKSQILSGVRLQENSPDFGAIPPIDDIVMVSYRPHIFFQLNMDGYNVSPDAKWKVDIVVETQSGDPFGVPIVVAYYRDRAAFMADATSVLARNYEDNPRNAFVRNTFASNISSAIMSVDVLNNEQCYISVHIAPGSAIPSAIPIRIFVSLRDNYGDYSTATLLDKRKLPWQNLPPIADQFTPNSDIYKFPLRSIYDRVITKIGYDISGVSNNFLDFYIQGTDNTYYDPANITDYTNGTRNGLRYLFELGTAVGAIPVADSLNEWSLYFGAGSQNQILDTYETGAENIYMSSLSQQKRMKYDTNESVLVNWFSPLNTNSVKEMYASPVTTTSTQNTFLFCSNPSNPLSTDVSTLTSYQDLSGFHGLSFFLNPNDIVKLQNIQIKFTYMQPSKNNLGVPFTRINSVLANPATNGFVYQHQATATSLLESTSTSWDDWFLRNRRNIRIGIFKSGDISGADIQSLSINNALFTLTLKKVTQVGQYTNSFGTFRTREPEWGTYYTYEQVTQNTNLYDAPVSDTGPWRITTVSPDITPTFIAGNTSYPGYFLTHTNIQNYSYIPRSFGIATAVGHSVEYPNLYVSSFMSDIQNSYTIIPFFNDPIDGQWKVGSFFAVSYTSVPVIPTTDITGDTAPYFGPPGIYAWDRSDPSNTSTLTLANGMNTSFKPYYWNMKIDFEVLGAEYDPATDLAAFGGFTGISGELQDTYMFFYRNTTQDADLADISGVNMETMPATEYWKWGIEQNTNYYAWDDQSGYNYLSYINGMTVRSTNVSTYNHAIHVRGYAPTSQFNTGLRLIGKNYTDFGTATLQEISDEIADLYGYSTITNEDAYNYTLNPSAYSTVIHQNDAIRLGSGNFYSHQYADALMKFNNLFKYPTGITFGKKIGYSGVSFPLTGYGNTIDTYVVYYSTLRGTLQLYTDVLSTTTGRLNLYVRDRYAGILPESVLTRTRVTDPIPFSLLFQSKLESPYDTQFDEWGLGWNLGFKKADTSFLTTHVSDTFIRITQDYIYLRLNPEMNLNTMGVSGKEDLSLTRDTFAEDQKYFAKILLNNFGGFCRAAVQMPKEFNPVLGKYDTISMQLVDRNGIQIANDDCDYDIVLEISEVVDAGRDKFAVPQGW
jgi:hypothetical protein